MTTDPRTDDELNRIIAEWMGWIYHNDHHDISYTKPDGSLGNHDFCNDLNAMQEAEDGMSKGQLARYVIHLGKVCSGGMRIWRAKAHQRAEALVKVIEENRL